MTGKSKRELLEAIRPRYRRAKKKEKTRIPDEFVAITGYHRKHAIRLLKQGVKPPGKEKRGRPSVKDPCGKSLHGGGDHRLDQDLESLWFAANLSKDSTFSTFFLTRSAI